MSKIVSKEIFKEEIRPVLRIDNKTIALCHGVFDLVHPGHIIHLQQAKEMADVLVVSVTAAKYVRKGPGRPYFNDELRLQFLAAIECVDYVMLSEGYTVEDIVESVEPDIYVKGEEYAKEGEDLTGKITSERKFVEQHGGKIKYTGGQVFSSTKMINIALSGLPQEVIRYMEDFKTRYSMEDVRHYTQKASLLKILVVGDIIIDKYTYCTVQGLMSKDTAYSSRLDYTEEYLGGAGIIARHLHGFSENVTIMSIVGNEEDIQCQILEQLEDEVQMKLEYSKLMPTIIKHRYLTRNAKRDEYRKIFSISNIQTHMDCEKEVKDKFKKQLIEEIGEFDAVFVCDFGHGLIDNEIKEMIEEKAKYLVLNCQANSMNYGLNIITKYKKADLFTLDQKELRLAYPMYASDEQFALQKLSGYLHGKGWLTRGSSGAWGIEEGNVYECPAFTLKVKDTVGAGDAFYAVAGLYAAAGAPIEFATMMGNVGGALAVNIVGNKEPVEKVNILKFTSTLMNV